MAEIHNHLRRHAFMFPPEVIIDEAKNGRIFILVDDDDRECEGDLVIPAQMVTPERINFMAKFGRGLICLALTRSRVDRLGLHLMSRTNDARHETAFTTSIEAREGVTTGISAADRARTIAVAIDARNGARDIVTPGHVFPLAARDGGVLVRAGHTEAAVDYSRLAGLNPSAVICAIMNEDGTMSRMDDLVALARQHELKIGTMRDLIAYRRRNDRLVERRAEVSFNSRWGGRWRAVTYFNKASGDETVALVMGEIDPAKPTLVRMHTLSTLIDVFGELHERSGLLSQSMEMISQAGVGAIVVINRSTHDAASRGIALRAAGNTLGSPEVQGLRDYGTGAQILADLGVQDIILLTNTHYTPVAIGGYGLSIVEERRIDSVAS